MNSQSMAGKFEQHNQKNSIRKLLEILRKRVKYFTVIDSQDQLIGKVKDLILDANGQINLLIDRQTNDQSLQKEEQSSDKHRLVVLRSQKIKKIDAQTKSVFLDIEQSQVEYMPEYLGTETPDENKIADNSTEQPANNQIINSQVESANLEKVDEEKIIRLLEERLVVDSSKRKVGEVIVRKEIETRMVQVPVRREKLIVEQVSPEHKQLAEIDLEQGEISGIELTEGEIPEVTSFKNDLTAIGDFSSPKIASLLLNAIALERNHGCQQVRVAVTVTDESTRKKYQEWFDRCSKGQQPRPEI
ncbi:YsnF/AvaK domain-containing protein [Dendronalium sp. ChiSLP03b]|uniref:YsnF/AvaK domain-containing protein n=1 Tax=Dendronalium sp. ChiSLP03b TaxID=3075381 RepID=UPI002AD5481E|nr:DUF2382 domain-containing protein [Dendronalium sp. ChiSLP03b]MDZ8204053.1 DUF2382 domain-containing protein [Dendronalium sp. ChiSLP03b]